MWSLLTAILSPHEEVFRFFTIEMYINLTGEKLDNALQKGYEAAAAASKGFTFRDVPV